MEVRYFSRNIFLIICADLVFSYRVSGVYRFQLRAKFQRPVEDHTVSMEDPEKNLLQLGKGGDG